MLTPLGLYLLLVLLTCTMDLMICRPYDTDWAEIGATRSHPAEPESVVDSILREWRPYFDPMDDLWREEEISSATATTTAWTTISS